jgi:hypothetical protein
MPLNCISIWGGRKKKKGIEEREEGDVTGQK